MADKSPKHPRYQDYVIKNGALVGAFEEMYKDHDDPWLQSQEDPFQPDKALALNALRRLGNGKSSLRVLEIGSGLGGFSAAISAAGFDTYGLEVSETAVEKARDRHSGPTFITGDILSREVYADIRPDVLVMSEITWYVLDKIKDFLDIIHATLPDVHLVHILTMYPESEQQYGREFFTTFEGLIKYFGLDVVEQAVIDATVYDGTQRTYFLGRWG
jgi:SAM-dependent methyltransferase